MTVFPLRSSRTSSGRKIADIMPQICIEDICLCECLRTPPSSRLSHRLRTHARAWNSIDTELNLPTLDIFGQRRVRPNFNRLANFFFSRILWDLKTRIVSCLFGGTRICSKHSWRKCPGGAKQSRKWRKCLGAKPACVVTLEGQKPYFAMQISRLIILLGGGGQSHANFSTSAWYENMMFLFTL